MTDRRHLLLVLSLVQIGCGPEIDTEDADELCDWVLANDPADCDVEECFDALCVGANTDLSQCRPVIRASRDGMERVGELSHRRWPGISCYVFENPDGDCAELEIRCDEVGYK